jgi:hypothetical protein
MSLVHALGPVVDALSQLGVDYQIGGSVASSAHGTPRSTLDVDLVANLRIQHADPLCAILRPDFYAEPELVRHAIHHRSCVNFLHLASGYKVDVFVVRDSDYDRLAFTRFVEKGLAGDPSGRLFRIATAEDILLRKMLWYRAGDESSDRQWQDILGVLRVQMEALDHAYLFKWATKLGLESLLARAEAEL